MTALSSINSDINLDNLYKNAVINDVLTFIQHGSLGTKGESNNFSNSKGLKYVFSFD